MSKVFNFGHRLIKILIIQHGYRDSPGNCLFSFLKFIESRKKIISYKYIGVAQSNGYAAAENHLSD